MRKYSGEQGRGEFPDLGLEKTPEEHIERMVSIFREIKRVLRDDGVVWLNYGDSFMSENIRADDVAPLSGIDASWLAALIDTDGTIQIHRQNRGEEKPPGFQAHVAVCQTKTAMIKRAHDLCGGALWSPKRKTSTHRTLYEWVLRGQQAAPILRAIYPYLMLKQGQAALAIMLCKDLKDKKFHRVRPVTQEAIEYRTALHESIKDLNNYRQPKIDPQKPKLFKHGMSQGNLMLMPHRVAIALQDDGWIVRNDLIWFKRNPMPESVAGWRWERARTKTKSGIYESDEKQGQTPTGAGLNQRWRDEEGWSAEYEYGDDYVLRKGSWRHTRAHEYIFQLVKKMGYYCNQEAVREIGSENSHGGGISGIGEKYNEMRGVEIEGYIPRPAKETSGRNPRTVLDVPTAPYKGAHYATFPPNLIAPLIRASCPRRSCPECGQAWAPVVEKSGGTSGSWHDHSNDDGRGMFGGSRSSEVDSRGEWEAGIQRNVLDYHPTCSHNHDPIPGIVLDPFIGSGTTGAVARELQRRWIGLDISMDYIDQQAKVRALKWTPSNALDQLPLFKKETAYD